MTHHKAKLVLLGAAIALVALPSVAAAATIAPVYETWDGGGCAGFVITLEAGDAPVTSIEYVIRDPDGGKPYARFFWEPYDTDGPQYEACVVPLGVYDAAGYGWTATAKVNHRSIGTLTF